MDRKGKGKMDASTEVELRAQDYLIPMSTIRDTLLRPENASAFPTPIVHRLLSTVHLQRLKSPWSSLTSQTPGPSSATSTTFTIPNTSFSLEISQGTRDLASRLASKAKIDETSALMLCKSYESFALDDNRQTDSRRLERVLAWWSQEVVAIVEVATAIIRLGSVEGEWFDVCKDLKWEVMGNAGAFIEGLFRAFSGLAQQQLESTQRSDNPLFWYVQRELQLRMGENQGEGSETDLTFRCRHQLQLQDALLQLLFLVLYHTPDRQPTISEALIKGSIYSAFGTSQANREYWDSDPECQILQSRIRDSLVLIAVESTCLSTVVTPGDPDSAERLAQGTLLRSKAHIAWIHQFILDQTADLNLADGPEGVDMEIATWPISIVCLAWSIVINALPADLVPNFSQYSSTTVYQELAQRALRISSGLFPWIETILSGPLLQDVVVDLRSAGNELPTFSRKVIKDLLSGLMELVNIEVIPDHDGLNRVWSTLYSGGSPGVNLALCADFWAADSEIDARRSLFDTSRFPLRPSVLLNALAALSVPEVDETTAQNLYEVDPTTKVCEYFNAIYGFTHVVNPRSFKFDGKDATGRPLVEATTSIQLPGGVVIPEGTSGTMINNEDSEAQIVSWHIHLPGWNILVEILRAAVGLPPSQAQAEGTLPVSSLGIQEQSTDILLAGFKFLHSILRPSAALTTNLIRVLAASQIKSQHHPLVEVISAALASSTVSVEVTIEALGLLQSLLLSADTNAWDALRISGFFGGLGRKRSSASTLLQNSHRGIHTVTTSVLRLVLSLIETSATLKIADDDNVLRSALILAFTEVWSVFTGWRYQNVAEKFEIASLLFEIFDTVLRHPISRQDNRVTPSAETLMDLFVTNASALTYRPVIDTVTQANAALTAFVGSHREKDAQTIIESVNDGLGFLSTLFRVASSIKVPAPSLPFSIVSASVLSGSSSEKVQLVDYLLDLTCLPTTQPETSIAIVKTVRTYLEAINVSPQKTSLASYLRDPTKTFSKLADLAESGSPELRASTWLLLGCVVATQPGCASASIGPISLEKVDDGTLQEAINDILDSESLFLDGPQILSGILSYINSVLLYPGAKNATTIMRNHPELWHAIFDIATRSIPTPPTFQLSMHADDFASNIGHYAYSVQAKATATSILATELALSTEADITGTHAQTLISGLFKDSSSLADRLETAIHSSCNPTLHEEMESRLKEFGQRVMGLKTIALANDREYGLTYLYDAIPVIPHDSIKQSTVNLALDMLNLNWSMLDADIALTKSWLSLIDSAASLTQGDPLAAKAALGAAVQIAESLAEEDRAGDVMFAIQVERLSILASLLETALDAEQEVIGAKTLKQIAIPIRRILENPAFPPILSLRHPNIPAIHKPVLNILYLVVQSLSRSSSSLAADTMLDEAVVFVLEAADVILDSISRGSLDSTGDLALIIGILNEVIRHVPSSVWLDRLVRQNLITRTLDVVVRTRILPPVKGSAASNGSPPLSLVAPHIPLILLFHLALASHPESAEKLAVSGVLPAYSDNAIAVAAEQGSILAPAQSVHYSVHGTWYAMLLVIKSLLSTLPETSSYVRSDLVPFIRVGTAQFLRVLEWDGESPLSQPALDELETITEIFYGISHAVGGQSILNDFSGPAIFLLKSIRYALSHPHVFSTLVIPSSEDEYQALEKELEAMERNVPALGDILDEKKYPIVASRIHALLRITRTVLMTLVSVTNAWLTLKGEGVVGDSILESEDENISTSTDPVGILNDLFTLALSATGGGTGAGVSKTLEQITELTAILSTTQLITRRTLIPEHDHARVLSKTASPPKTSSSEGDGGGESRLVVQRELESDLMGMLGGDEVAGEGILGWLSAVAAQHFSLEE